MRNLLPALFVCLLAIPSLAQELAVGDRVRINRGSIEGEGIIKSISGKTYLVEVSSGRFAGRTMPLPGSFIEKVIPAAADSTAPADAAANTTESVAENPFEPGVDPKEFREWSDASGQFKIVASIVKLDAETVTLTRKIDSREVAVPIKLLSSKDREFIQLVRSSARLQEKKQAPINIFDPGADSSSDPKSPTGSAPPLAQHNRFDWQAHPDPRKITLNAVDGFATTSTSHSPKLAVPLLLPSAFAFGTKEGFRIWDVQRGKQTGLVKLDSDWYPGVSPDAKYLLSGSSREGIRVYSSDGQLVTKISDVHYSALAQFCSSDRLMTVYGQQVAFWNPQTGQLLAENKSESRNSDIAKTAISPGGNYVAVSDTWGKKLEIIDTRNAAKAGEIVASGSHGERMAGITFSPDGSELAAINNVSNGKATIYCWSMKTGKLVSEISITDLDKHLGQNSYRGKNPIDYIPDYGWLIFEQAIVKRELGQITKTLSRGEGFGQNQRWVLNRDQVLTYDTSTRAMRIESLPWNEISEGEQFIASGATALDVGRPVLTNPDLSAIKTFPASLETPTWAYDRRPAKANSGKVKPILLNEPVGSIRQVNFSEDRIFVGIRGSNRSNTRALKKIVGYDRSSTKEVLNFELPFEMTLEDVTHDGQRLLFVDSNTNDRIDVYRADQQHLFGFRPYLNEQGENAISFAAFVGPDHIVTQDVPGNITLWKVPECKAVYRRQLTLAPATSGSSRATFFRSLIQRTAMNSSHKYMATFVNGELLILETTTGRLVGNLQLPTTSLNYLNLCFNANDNTLAACHGTGVWTWDLTDGQLKDQFPVSVGAAAAWFADDLILMVKKSSGNTVTPNNVAALDLDKGKVIWNYGISYGSGTFFDTSPNGLTWFAVAQAANAAPTLGALQLPHRNALSAMRREKPFEPVFGEGTNYALSVKVRLIESSSAARTAEQDIQTEITESFAKLGAQRSSRGQVRLVASVDEALRGNRVQLNVAGGTVGVEITQFVCQLKLLQGEKVLWESRTPIDLSTRLEGELDPSVGLVEQLKQQQWDKALKWFGETRPKTPLISKDFAKGLGISSVTPKGLGPAIPLNANSSRGGVGRRGRRP